MITNKKIIVDDIEEESKEVKEAGVVDHPYTIESYENVGRAVCIGILDFYELNPISRIPTTKYKNLKNIKQELLQKIEEDRIKSSNSSNGKIYGKRGKAKSTKVSEAKTKSAKFWAPYKKAAESFMIPKVVIK